MSNTCCKLAPVEMLVGSLAGLNGSSACKRHDGHEGVHFFRNRQGSPIVWEEKPNSLEFTWWKISEREAQKLLSGDR